MIEDVLRATVKTILRNALAYQGWTLQGLGMLRLRLDDRHRIHVWSNDHRVPGVTDIHDHPWNLVSHVISGQIENVLYRAVDPDEGNSEIRDAAEAYVAQPIKCGPHGNKMGESNRVWLHEWDRATFLAGQDYSQMYYEIHKSVPSDGAVSLIETWTPTHVDRDKANVYFKLGGYWVSAEPRPATPAEIREITERALVLWS